MRFVRQGLVFIFTFYLSLVYMVGCASFQTIDDKKYIIPKSFETDLASIPRLLWPLFAPQYSGFVAPAILHDYLYRCPNDISREFADEVLYSALIVENVSPFTASKFYLGVRLFGHSHFKHGVC